MSGWSTRATTTAARSAGSVWRPSRSDEPIPVRQAGLCAVITPGRLIGAAPVTITIGSAPPSRSSATPRSARVWLPSSISAFGCPSRLPSPAARSSPATRSCSGCGALSVVMNPPGGRRQRPARATPPELDQLRGDRHRRFLRRARTEIKAHRRAQPGQFILRHARLPQPAEAIFVRPPAAHRADVSRGRAQCDLKNRDVELRVVRQDADDRALICADAGQVPVRPVDHDLVGVGEPGCGGEDRPSVAHRNPVPEELADPGHGRREVDRTEDDHPRRGRERLHEDRELVHAALALGAVMPHAGQSLREHSPGVVVDGLVKPVAGGEAAGRVPLAVGWPDHAPCPYRSWALDHGRDADRLVRPYGHADLAEFRKALLADRLDEDVDDAAAGQAHAERGVVAYPVALQDWLAGRDHLARQLVYSTLHAATRHAADDLAARGDRERRAGLTRSAAERPDHGRQAELLAGIPPLDDLVQNVPHRRSPALN